MLARLLAISLNTYREAVRARVLFGLLAVALATSAYSLVVASISLRHEMRVVADLGAASISLYAVLVALVLGATSLYRELELKTLYPILTRRLRRHEFIVGKYLGTLATLAVFVMIDGATVLTILTVQSHERVGLAVGVALALVAALVVALVVAKRSRTYVVLPWAAVAFGVMCLVASPAGPERQVLLVSMLLTMAEVAIICAASMLFSAFSTPLWSAIFTVGVFLVGRSSDTLAALPERMFGVTISRIAYGLSKVFPNLNVYVPPRAVMLGQVPEVHVWSYIGRGCLNSFLYAALLLAVASLAFRKRDLT